MLQIPQANQARLFSPHVHSRLVSFSGGQTSEQVKPMDTFIKGWELAPNKQIELFKESFANQKVRYDFAGDNVGPANPAFLKAQALALSIQHDTYQSIGALYDRVRSTFKDVFTDKESDPFLLFLAPTGTAANRLGLSPILRSIDMIITSDISHLYAREAGGYHSLNRASAYPLKSENGKISVKQLEDLVAYFKKTRREYYAGYSKPRVVSISQPTEYGTYYRAEEVQAIAKLCHDNGMLLQMDGSRLFYLPKLTNKSLKELTTDLGVDLVFLGGSKNGMAMSEAIVFTPNFFENIENLGITTDPKHMFNTMRAHSKQSGNLVSQFVGAAAQFTLALEKDYLINQAYNGVQKAKDLEKVLTQIPNSRLFAPVETNLVLMSLPEDITKAIENRYELKVFPEPDPEMPGNRIARFMTNYSTTSKQIEDIEKYLKENKIIA